MSKSDSAKPSAPQNKPGSHPVDVPIVGRSLFGGFLMGLANLVPGISGGTMLLAAGIYPAFIESLSDITRFRFNLRSWVILASVGTAAGLAVLLLAGTLKTLVVDHRWVMYSLFIGLTLGGVPIVWRLTRQRGPSLWAPAVVAFGLMCAMALVDANAVVNQSGSNFILLFLAGLAGASAMILPGLSGAYLLLLMGQYVAILDSVDALKEALKQGDVQAAMTPALQVVLPVGIGVVVGIVVVGNLIKWLLNRYRTQTLGLLLGLLFGSVVGLYPFQQGVAPKVGDRIKGRVLTEETVGDIEADDWPLEQFVPQASQVAQSIGLVLLGLAITTGVGWMGGSEEANRE